MVVRILARRRDHIRPVLGNVHWLLVSKRITFKTAVLVWKCLHDAAPCYLMDLCRPVTSADGRHLRSATSGHCLSRSLEQLSASAASPSMDRPRGIDFLRHTAFTGADAAYVQTQTEDASVAALIVGELIVQRCCDCFGDFGIV